MLKKAFENNFYTSEEFVHFCEDISGHKRNQYLKDKENLNILKNTNISIDTFSSTKVSFMKKHNIKFFQVLLENNDKSKNPSFMEYPIWLYRSYDQALKDFDKTFRKYARRAEKQNYETKIRRDFDFNLLDEIYKLYVKQMRRLNGIVFPKKFFEKFMKLKSSFVFLIYYEENLAGYSFCFENKDNLYTSVGGGDKKYFKKYINYKIYYEKIKYACENKLNIHMGLGNRGSGFNFFKTRTGAVCLKLEIYPPEGKLFKFLIKLVKYKFMGWLLEIFSRLFPKKAVFAVMPFT